MDDRVRTTEWREACEKRIGDAHHWDISHRENRVELRLWKRRLFWAKYGVYLAAFLGIATGSTIAYFAVAFFGGA